MELRVLRYFLAVAEEGTITAGSARVRISQPAVSRQLAALERELGTPLFERGHGALTLTHAGRRFLEVARDLVRREETARAVVGRAHDAELRLTVVAQATTIVRTLAPFTAAHGGRRPMIDALESTPARVYNTVLAAGADLGISTIAPPAGWASRRLSEVGIAAHVPPGHPLFDRDSVEVRELVRHPLVLMDRSHMARLVFDTAVAACGVEVPHPVEMRSSSLAQALAASGRGVAVLTDAAAYGLHPVRIMLDGAQVRMRMHAGWDRSHYAAAAIERWVDDFAAWLPTIPDIARVSDPPEATDPAAPNSEAPDPPEATDPAH